MNRFIILLVLFTLFAQEPAQAIAQENVISGFLKNLLNGKNLRKRGRKVEEVEAAEAVPVDVMRIQPRGNQNAAKRVLATRKERLDAYFEAYAEWVDLACELSDDQKTELNKAISAEIEVSQKAFEAKKPNARQNHSNYLFEYSPISMMYPETGLATNLEKLIRVRILTDILDSGQKKKFSEAIQERKQALHERFLAQILQKADNELFLSPKKKEQLKNLFPDQLPLLTHGLYSFKPQTHYIKELPIINIITHPPLAYTKIQMNRIQDLRRSTNSYISFQSSEGIETWRDKLDDSAEDQKEIILHKINLQRAFLEKQYQLKPQEKRYLELASKGVAEQTVGVWKKKSLKQMAQWEKQVANMQGQNFGFGLVGIQASSFNDNQLWLHTIKKVIPELSYKQRAVANEQAVIGYAVAMLDQELWFTAEQRKKVQAALQGMQSIDFAQQNHQQRDLALLGVTIHGKKRRELDIILTETQLKTITVLRNQLSKQGNYVMILSRHGNLHLQVIEK